LRTVTEKIKDYHSMGHFASAQIYMKLLKDGHFWSGMRQDIDKFIQSCESCQRVNLIREGFHPLMPITAKLPMDHVAVDLKEMPETPMHEKYLLVMADVATDYMVLKVLRNKDEYSVARALWEIFAFLGLPTIIQSDNGAEFVNKVIKAFVELHGIDHRLIAAYHPRANGFVERKNLDIQQIFKKVLNGAIQEWVPWVPFVQLAYNNRISSRTGSTAFSLMFGRTLRIFKEPVAADAAFDLSRWQENIE
jgi:transposase InsO family protein